jgi:hypothetical protein
MFAKLLQNNLSELGWRLFGNGNIGHGGLGTGSQKKKEETIPRLRG